ncbi:hypothetical protein FKM82_006396 [Ascaphus truei]
MDQPSCYWSYTIERELYILCIYLPGIKPSGEAFKRNVHRLIIPRPSHVSEMCGRTYSPDSSCEDFFLLWIHSGLHGWLSIKYSHLLTL